MKALNIKHNKNLNNNQEEVIRETVEFVRKKLEGEGSGHDWWHVFRVWKNATNISKKEKADLFIVELAALLHDIADWKFYNGNETIGPKVARKFLNELNVEENIISNVCDIIKKVSFKGGMISNKKFTIQRYLLKHIKHQRNIKKEEEQ